MKGRLTIAPAVVTAAMAIAAVGIDASAQQPRGAEPYRVRVVDDRDAGVPKIGVEVRAPGRPLRTLTTGGDGRVTIPADVAVEGAMVSAARGREAVAWAQVGDSTRSGQGREVAITLIPLSHRVEGSIVDPQGRPIAGARVGVRTLLHPTNGRMTQDVQGQDPMLGLAVTDEAGKFAVALPEAARATLMAVHPYHVGGPIEVATGSRTLRPTTVHPAGAIAGRVTDASTGKPVAGASVAAQFIERRRRLLADGWGQAMSDAEGRFQIGGLEPGVFNVFLLEVPGRKHAAAAAVEAVRVKAGAQATADLAATEGRPLRGIVIDHGDDNKPLAGARVACQGPAHPRSGSALMATTTDEGGRFTFHVPPGEQFVFVIDDPAHGRMGRRIAVAPERGEVQPVFLLISAGEESASTPAIPEAVVASAPLLAPAIGAANPAEKPRTVTGRVSDPTGRPIAGIRVAVNAYPRPKGADVLSDALEMVVTDRDGTFILDELPREPTWLTLGRPLDQVLKEKLAADRDELTLTYRPQIDEQARRELGPVEDEPIPPALRDRLTFVDLTPYGTEFLADGPGEPNDGNNLNQLPRGVHKLRESYFRIGDKMVLVRGTGKPKMPLSVAGIKVAARGKRLHLLHGTEIQAAAATKLGDYVIHYADGRAERMPIIYDKNVINWWGTGLKEDDLPEARIAWRGSNAMLDKRPNPDIRIGLWALTWTNPHPEKEIATIDVVSSVSACDPYLVAVTVEREK